ncbi:hypothetical protein [Streptomyces sp. NPDC093589]|uniref:hypothetical protein n=1 Tax=Streptomyces sp. NPDC093589 TaxID=3366043 RepID=UPI00382ABAD4
MTNDVNGLPPAGRASSASSEAAEVWGYAELGEAINVKPATVRYYWSQTRHLLPKPDVMMGGKPGWFPGTVKAWKANRPGQGSRSDLQGTVRTGDRSGDPDEELSPADQARLLGMHPTVITTYRKQPPRGWPGPVRTEELPRGRVREYRTRRQLLEYLDSRARLAPDRRVEEAVRTLTARPEAAAGKLAAELAVQHGGSVDVWKRAVAKARRQLSS